MSIQSEIERIRTNVQNSFSIIANAGIEVAADANSDDLPDAISALAANSGGGEAMTIETIWEICGYDPNALPDGYTKLDYIQSSGTQYIDTGYYPTQDTRVVMDAQLTTATSSSNQWLFCGRKATKNSVFGFYHYNGYFGAGYGSEQADQLGSMDALTRLNIDFTRNVLSFNGVSQTFTEQTFTATGSLCLLARNSAGTIAAKASAKLYSCQVYDNDTLIRDFVPCINPSGVYGLFDRVNKLFYANAGTGSFTGG